MHFHPGASRAQPVRVAPVRRRGRFGTTPPSDRPPLGGPRRPLRPCHPQDWPPIRAVPIVALRLWHSDEKKRPGRALERKHARESVATSGLGTIEDGISSHALKKLYCSTAMPSAQHARAFETLRSSNPSLSFHGRLWECRISLRLFAPPYLKLAKTWCYFMAPSQSSPGYWDC